LLSLLHDIVHYTALEIRVTIQLRVIRYILLYPHIVKDNIT